MKEKIFETNSYYEGLIQNFYGGAKGCFVSFMQFFYQYNQAKFLNENICVCLKDLYESELKNCEILSNILLKMGGDNKYYSCSRKFLSGYNVDYIKNFSQIFLADIEMLEVSIIDLKNIIYKIDNIYIKDELKQILQNKKQSLTKIKENYLKNSKK